MATTSERAYSADDRKKMAAKGEAMPDGSYPIANASDLASAIKLSGSGNASNASVRRHIIKRARALGLTNMIPDSWGAGGTKTPAGKAPPFGGAKSAEPAGIVRMLEVPFTLTRDDGEDGDGLTLTGYAAVFNSVTHIEDQDGIYDEVIRPGAFKRTLDHNPRPPLMFEHGRHPLIGKMPIGAIRQLTEDPRGLFVRARLFDNWMIEPVRDAIREEAIPGMSFRFEIPRGGASMTPDRNGTRLRSIREAKLYELGPVVFPAYADTTLALRSLERAVPSIHIITTGSDMTDTTETDTPDPVREAFRAVADALRTLEDALVPTALPAENTDDPTREVEVEVDESEAIDDALTRDDETEDETGTPAEPAADHGTSDEPADAKERQMPQTLAERQAYLRRLDMERRNIRQEKKTA
jgi:HK97 family phage prohead protease